MNKLNILFLGALVGIGMVACDDKLPVAPPQANEQGPVLEGFDGAYATLEVSDLDLQAAFESGDDILVMYSVNAGTSGIPQSDIYGELEISNSADFAQSVLLPAVDGIVGTVSLSDLNDAHIQLFGYAPYPKDVYYRVPLYANVDGSTYRLGSLDSFGASGTYEESCAPGFSIDEMYYIIGVEGWDPQDAVPMTHADGVSAYDDPYFTYEVSSENAVYWKIVPPDVYAQVGEPGFDANTDFWPNLYSVYKGDNPNYGTLEIADGPSGEIQAGTWTISVNMKDLTYDISGTPAGLPDWVGTPNDSQGWNIESSMKLMPYGDNYKGFSYFGGEWGGKLAYSLDGSDVWIGMTDGTTEEKTVDDNGFTSYEVALTPAGGGNIFEGVGPYMYFISYNFPDSTAKFYLIETCGIIGGFNDWGAQEPMTAVADSNDMKWTLTYTFDSDTDFKFRFNDNWDVNLGGDLDDLAVDGSNISVTAGTYEITLDITNVPYSATITAK